MSDFKIVSVLNPMVQIGLSEVAAGTTSITSGVISFSNANGVSFGISGQTITGSVNAGVGVALSAGTNSTSTGTVVFSNSNGVTFGMNTNGVVTASHNGLTSQSNQAFSANGGSSAFQTLGFSDANGITWTNTNGSVAASYSQSTHSHSTAPGAIAAGTQTATSGTVLFSNANGISFGMSDSSRITASYTVPSVAGLLSAVNVSAGTTSNNLSAFTFDNAGGVTFGLNGSVITAAAPAGGGGITNINVSAGTTSNNLSALTFSNSNGISFGLNASTVTASHNGLTSQSNQALSAGNGSFTFQTATFADSNGVSFSTGTQGIYATVKTDYLTSQSSWSVSDAATSGTVGRLAFTNLNGVTLSLSTGAGGSHTIVGSHNALTTQSGQAFSADASSTFQTLTFQNSNGVSFSNNAGALRVTHDLQYTSNTSNITSNALNTSASRVMNIVAATNSTGGGTASLSSNVSFSAANGVTFYTSAGNAVVASVVTSYRASNDAVGLNTALTAGPLAWTVNSAGISLNASSAAGTTSGFAGNLISGSMTHNTAGLNLSLNHPAWLTTARASNDGIGLNTAQSNVTWTVNSSGMSLDARGYAGTGTSATNASVTLNSNGLAISVAAPGGGGAVNVSAGTTSNNLQTMVFSNSNGVSFGLNGSTITASVDAGGGLTNINISAGTTSNNLSALTFSNSNGVVFGLNGSTITASYNDVTESMFWRPNDLVTTVGAPINASASIVYCPVDHNLSATRFDLMASVSVATAANNSSAGFLYSITAALYTLNGATLSSVSSGTTANQMTWTSNATGSVTGNFFLSAPVDIAAAADKYWVGVQLSTRATGLTGAATTSLGNTVSMMGVGSAVAGAFSAREPGSGTANSNGWFYGMGMYSGTTNFSTIALSNLTQQGTNMNRANVAMRMRNV